jgi:hypothetical protein
MFWFTMSGEKKGEEKRMTQAKGEKENNKPPSAPMPTASLLAQEQDEHCLVSDPTGTPLNIRDVPNGRILSALENRTQVNIEDLRSDVRGRSWAKISDSSHKILGWVFREFITCDKKQESNQNTNAISPTTQGSQSQERFSVVQCGSIKDARTRLEWMVGPDRNMTWHEARQWVAGLGACGGGWRMPTVEEIRSLYDPAVTAGTGYYTNGRYYPAHIDPVFSAIGGGSWVWSNESARGDNARSFNLNQGRAVEYSATNAYYSTRAFAVRNVRN